MDRCRLSSIVVTVTLVALATVSCADGSGPQGAAPSSSGSSPHSPSAAPSSPVGGPSAPGASANAAALDFSARRLGGGTVVGRDLAGGDVVLWMWAPW